MLRHERRLLTDCLLIGAALTSLLILFDAAGALSPLENWLYDFRIRTCQFFTPKPTDKLVHLDLDDRALEVVGRWPWPRAKWARILDELRLAGPKAVEMDVILSEPQEIEFRELPGGKMEKIDNDAELAAAVGRLDDVILPLSIDPVPPPSREYAAMVELYRAEPDLSETELAQRLAGRGITVTPARLAEQGLPARRDAVYARVATEINNGADAADLRHRLLPRQDADVVSPLTRLIDEQLDRLMAVNEFARFAFPLPPGGETRIARGRIKLIPLRTLSENAAGGAFVDYPRLGGPVVRSVPLLLRDDTDHVYATMGLRLACRMMGANLSRMRVETNELLIDDSLRIPLAPPQTSIEGVPIGVVFNIPWFGGGEWQTMYDYPAHQRIAHHISINGIWEVCLTRDRIDRNFAQMDEALRAMYELLDPAKLRKFNDSPPPPLDLPARAALIAAALKDGEQTFALIKDEDPTKLDEREQKFLASAKALPRLRDQTQAALLDLQKQRADLSAAFKDKAVMIGWIATGATDFVPTPLHQKCPGVVVHGAVFNAIMTGEMWRSLPWWLSALISATLAMLIAFTTARLAPMPALLIALAVACLFAVINGIVLFDYFNRILPAASPLLAIGVVWSGCTMTRLTIERTERRRITRRFSNYVDPKLVSYVLEHPEVRFDGEKREMTVVFTDLAGFTSLSDKLGEKIVPLLNELLGQLVPVIRDHHQGLVNKFLGDGIMFFFNAPKEDPHHAADAVATVLDMHTAIETFNQRLALRGLPPISMRAGICTGEMIVGDAGGAGAADYTVLGDAVNLASRLEAANKHTGTRTLMTARTVELLGTQFIVRPVGKLKVVGKDEAVDVFEPLVASKTATPADEKLAQLTTAMVENYSHRRFDACATIAAEIESHFGSSKLTQLYRSLCAQHLERAPDEDFDARIVLTEK